MRDWLVDPPMYANDRVPSALEPRDREPDPDPESLVEGQELLPLEASAADVLDQRREEPLDEEEENHQ
jgi:hypothetical protein